MKPIITRTWHGRTRAQDADRYLDYLNRSGIAGYLATPGNLSVEVWRRIEGDVCHFHTVTKWESLESIRAFAGEDIAKARYYPEDADFLLEFEEHVQHFETFVY